MESEPLIALVDDDRIFQLIAEKSIKATRLTNRIIQFSNGSDAINYLQEHANDESRLPDLLFLDISMPIADGWMFMEDYINLKPQMRKNIRIYMVSSSIDPRDIERARSMKYIEEYIIKPIGQDKFARIIAPVAE